MKDRAEKITLQIMDDAKAKVETINDEAKTQAEEIEKKARTQADKKKEQIIEQAKKDAEEQKRRITGMAQLEARKELLAAKQDIIGQVIDKIMDQLSGMDDQSYLDLMENLLLRMVERGDEIIVCSERDKDRIPSEFWKKINDALKKKGKKGELALSDETRTISGGFIILSDGVEINCSFESLFQLKKDELESDIADILFN